MTLKEIVKKYLADNGYGGLHNDDCGCFDDDLFPCDGPCDTCEPAYKVPAHCTTCETGCDASDTAAVWCLTTANPAQNIMEAVDNGTQQPQPAMRFRNMKAYRTAGGCGARCTKYRDP